MDSPDLDELDAANLVARHIKTKPPIVQEFRAEDAVNTYPELIQAAEAPVIDTSCPRWAVGPARSRVRPTRPAHRRGRGRVAGWLPRRAANRSSISTSREAALADVARRSYLRLKNVPQYPREFRRGIEEAVGGPNAWIDSYGLLSLSKLRFYSESMHEVRRQANPWADLEIPLARAKRWHPLNRGIWVAGRVTLAGHLLQAKGDRVAMHSSVEVRYPFLDEEVFAFLAQLDPRWKLRWFPRQAFTAAAGGALAAGLLVGKRRKVVIFRAPLDSFHMDPEPAFVGQLLSEKSLRRTGYFDPTAVRHWRRAFRQMRPGSLPRLSVEGGLAAVVATQLWHHLYIDANLAEPPKSVSGAS